MKRWALWVFVLWVAFWTAVVFCGEARATAVVAAHPVVVARPVVIARPVTVTPPVKAAAPAVHTGEVPAPAHPAAVRPGVLWGPNGSARACPEDKLNRGECK
jgi:hypothetical protein